MIQFSLNKYTLINQIMYQDCLELINDINIKSKETIIETLKEIIKRKKNILD